MSVLDPCAADVMELGDEQLRLLIIRLCEAELRSEGQSVASILAGGDQNARDGGIDLHIDSTASVTPWIPRLPLGIQVKAETMAASAIRREMRPHGTLRASISDIGNSGGSYIIACGTDDCTHEMIKERRSAMRAAADGFDEDQLVLDFYDADRLARWAASHPSVALWLTGSSGRSSKGWTGHSRWATHDRDISDEYLVDDIPRASFERSSEVISVGDALGAVRSILAKPNKVVRLVGLSGMGKTRFAQALFEEQEVEGTSPLNPALAVYGDAGAAPEVTPDAIANQLAARRGRAVLVVDNCPAALHRRLVPIVRQTGSNVSLLTIDFDIGDDFPEHTETLHLFPAGDNLIEQLLRQRAPTLSHKDRSRIAEFSGGNTRIALALATSSDVSGLAKLRDRQIMDRLFLTDRRAPDEALRRVARVSSLVYAFEMAPEETADETPHLAALAEVSEAVFQDKFAELLERGLAQQRGSQRAVLPQGLAARLADEGLDRTREEALWKHLVAESPVRLKRSFSRRLGLLHTNAQAIRIAERLIADAEQIDGGPDDNPDAWHVVEHVAPVAPKAALEFIARKFDRRSPNLSWWARSRDHRLLLALAHDAGNFEQAATLLGRLANAERSKDQGTANRKAFQSLFQIARSGTEAPPAKRFELVRRLLSSPDELDVSLGLDAVEASLRVKTSAIGSASSFGARVMSGGWSPSTDDEISDWFREALTLAFGAVGKRQDIRPLISASLGQMLSIAPLADLAISTLRDQSATAFWRDGWFAVCRAISKLLRNGEVVDSQIRDLEHCMRPKSVEDLFEAWVLGEPNKWQSPDGNRRESWDGFFENSLALGHQVSNAPFARRLVTKLTLENSQARAYSLGIGIGERASDPRAVWTEFKEAISLSGNPARLAVLLRGYFSAVFIRNPELVDAWIDEIEADPQLITLLAPIQLALRPIDRKGGERLLSALERAYSSSFEYLSELQFGRLSETIPDDVLSNILKSLSDGDRSRGPRIAIDVLYMRFHGSEISDDSSLIEAGRYLLLNQDLNQAKGRDHTVAEIARRCLTGPAGWDCSKRLLDALLKEIRDGFAVPECQEMVGVILSLHPKPALDQIFRARRTIHRSNLGWLLGGVDSDDGPEVRPIALVDDKTLMEWVLVDPKHRTSFVASHVSYFQMADGQMDWSPIARELMEIPGCELSALRAFESRFAVGSWTGSASSRFYRRMALASSLAQSPNAFVRDWATAAIVHLKEWIESTERRERGAGERFE